MTIGSANFDEAAVVAEIYAQALEAAGFTVERNLYTGPRETTLPALENGDLNLMPEYIGNLLSVGFGAPPARTRTRRSLRCRTSWPPSGSPRSTTPRGRTRTRSR